MWSLDFFVSWWTCGLPELNKNCFFGCPFRKLLQCFPTWILGWSKSYYHWSKPTWLRPCIMNWSYNKTRFNINLTFFLKHCSGNTRWLWRSDRQMGRCHQWNSQRLSAHELWHLKTRQVGLEILIVTAPGKQPPCALIAVLNHRPRNFLRTSGDGGGCDESAGPPPGICSGQGGDVGGAKWMWAEDFVCGFVRMGMCVGICVDECVGIFFAKHCSSFAKFWLAFIFMLQARRW